MLKISKNFDKQDCIHHKRIIAAGCCGRKYPTGVCTISDPDGLSRHKVCSIKMGYCKYQKKENVNVHT